MISTLRVFAASTLLAVPVVAQTAIPPYHVVRRITIGRFINPVVIAGKPYRYEAVADFLSVDSARRRLYGLGNTVLDIDHDTIVARLAGVAAGGYALAPDLGKGLTRKGTLFDLATLHATGTVSAIGDATVYDPVTHRAFLLDDTVTAVSMTTGHVVARRHFGAKLESGVADGTGKLFINREDSSIVLRVDATSLDVEARYPVPDCSAAQGLSMDRVHRRLFVGCDRAMVVVDADNGTVVARIRVTGHGDENAFDPGTMLAFNANWPDSTLTIVREDDPNTFTVVQTVKLGGPSNSVVVDPTTHKVYAFYYDQDIRRPATLEDIKRWVLNVAVLAPQQ